MKVFLVFGSDLRRDNNEVVLGDDSRLACQRAVQACSCSGNGSTIIAVAGEAPQEFDHVWMAELMGHQMKSLNEHVRFQLGKADAFNTFGEACMFASVVSAIRRPKVDEAVIIAKSWRMPRAKMDCEYWFDQYRVRVPIKTEPYDSDAPWTTRVLREWLATQNDRRKIRADR